jgi:DNA-directed RNA polymerase specialized sigma24 family protein
VDERVRALEAVYRRRYVGFRNALATVTGSYDTARDAVQEAFARALRDRESFRGGSVEAWIWRTALRERSNREPPRRGLRLSASYPKPSCSNLSTIPN